MPARSVARSTHVVRAHVAPAVALAGEREHRVRAGVHRAVDRSGQMHAEEREARVGHGIDERPDEVSGQRVRARGTRRGTAGSTAPGSSPPSGPPGRSAGRRSWPPRSRAPRRGRCARPARTLAARWPTPRSRTATTPPRRSMPADQRVAHLAEVDHGGLGDVQRGQADRVRLDVGQAGRTEPGDGHAVARGAVLERGRVGRARPARWRRPPCRSAATPRRGARTSRAARPGRSGTARPSGCRARSRSRRGRRPSCARSGGRRPATLLVDHHDRQPRLGALHGPGGGQPDDAGADHDHVGLGRQGESVWTAVATPGMRRSWPVDATMPACRSTSWPRPTPSSCSTSTTRRVPGWCGRRPRSWSTARRRWPARSPTGSPRSSGASAARRPASTRSPTSDRPPWRRFVDEVGPLVDAGRFFVEAGRGVASDDLWPCGARDPAARLPTGTRHDELTAVGVAVAADDGDRWCLVGRSVAIEGFDGAGPPGVADRGAGRQGGGGGDGRGHRHPARGLDVDGAGRGVGRARRRLCQPARRGGGRRRPMCSPPTADVLVAGSKPGVIDDEVAVRPSGHRRGAVRCRSRSPRRRWPRCAGPAWSCCPTSSPRAGPLFAGWPDQPGADPATVAAAAIADSLSRGAGPRRRAVAGRLLPGRGLPGDVARPTCRSAVRSPDRALIRLPR